MKDEIRSKILDLDKYVNIDTGQLLLDELSTESSIKITEKTGNKFVESDNYIVVDVDSLKYLRQEKIISSKDVGHIMHMSETLKTVYNAMFMNNNVPHTLASLSEYLGMSYDTTTRYIKKLAKKNIVHKYITAYDTYYCLNPYLTRRRKTIDSELLSHFSKFKR